METAAVLSNVIANEVAAVGVNERLAVAGAASKIRREDGVPRGRGNLRVEAGTPAGSAVRVDDQGAWGSVHRLRRSGQGPFDRPAVNLPAHDFPFRHQMVFQKSIGRGRQFPAQAHPPLDRLQGVIASRRVVRASSVRRSEPQRELLPCPGRLPPNRSRNRRRPGSLLARGTTTSAAASPPLGRDGQTTRGSKDRRRPLRRSRD